MMGSSIVFFRKRSRKKKFFFISYFSNPLYIDIMPPTHGIVRKTNYFINFLFISFVWRDPFGSCDTFVPCQRARVSIERQCSLLAVYRWHSGRLETGDREAIRARGLYYLEKIELGT